MSRYKYTKLRNLGSVHGFLIHTPDDRKLLDIYPIGIVRELNRMDERIKQLEDRIHRAAMAFFRDGSDGHVASQMLQILEEERNKP